MVLFSSCIRFKFIELRKYSSIEQKRLSLDYHYLFMILMVYIKSLTVKIRYQVTWLLVATVN